MRRSRLRRTLSKYYVQNLRLHVLALYSSQSNVHSVHTSATLTGIRPARSLADSIHTRSSEQPGYHSHEHQQQ